MDKKKVILCAGTIHDPFDVVGLVVGFASNPARNGVEKTYVKALESLEVSARSVDADGIIDINFQNRFASGNTCGFAYQVFEVFAWGTAIKFRIGK